MTRVDARVRATRSDKVERRWVQVTVVSNGSYTKRCFLRMLVRMVQCLTMPLQNHQFRPHFLGEYTKNVQTSQSNHQ